MEIFNYKKALWYWEALQYSDLPWKTVSLILNKVKTRNTVVDLGSGPGTVSIPLSYFFEKVYSVDISQGMAKKEKEELFYRNINNVNVINGSWEEFENINEDISLIIAMNFGGIFDDFDRFDKICKEKSPELVLIVKGERRADKFGWDSIKKSIGRKTKRRFFHESVLKPLEPLDIDKISYHFDQPFYSVADAVNFWNEYIKPENKKEKEVIVEYVKKNLEKRGDKYFAKVNSSAKFYWWRP